jgi:N-acetylglucosaminyldiphosphoundecaprenol N-acetyl-beta-D-mannosaminyltransferase
VSEEKKPYKIPQRQVIFLAVSDSLFCKRCWRNPISSSFRNAGMPDLMIHRVLDVPIHTLNDGVPPLEGYANWVMNRIQLGLGAQIITCNAEMVMLAQRENTFLQVLKQAELVIPDGAGVVWALRLQKVLSQRTPGIELAEKLIEAAAFQGWSVAVIGARPDVAETLQHKWQQQYPQFPLWVHHGYFDPELELSIITYLQQINPQLILVGLGSPRQEYWIQKHRALLPQGIWIGVGGSLDIWAGIKPRAPRWWRDHQMEWLYRLYQEPWRWRRMLALPQFVWQVALHVLPQQLPFS